VSELSLRLGPTVGSWGEVCKSCGHSVGGSARVTVGIGTGTICAWCLKDLKRAAALARNRSVNLRSEASWIEGVLVPLLLTGEGWPTFADTAACEKALSDARRGQDAGESVEWPEAREFVVRGSE
jgi:hypothetical protein